MSPSAGSITLCPEQQLLVSQLLHEGVHTDFEVVVNGFRAAAHRLILRWKIPYFAGLFSVTESTELCEGKVEIWVPGEVNAAHLQKVLEYSYGCPVTLEGLQDVQPLLSLAQYLQLDEFCSWIRSEALEQLQGGTSADVLQAGITDPEVLDALTSSNALQILPEDAAAMVQLAAERGAVSLMRCSLAAALPDDTLAIYLAASARQGEDLLFRCAAEEARELFFAGFAAYAECPERLLAAPPQVLLPLLNSDGLQPGVLGERGVAAVIDRLVAASPGMSPLLAARRLGGLERADRVLLHSSSLHLVALCAVVSCHLHMRRSRVFIRLSPCGVRSEWEVNQLRLLDASNRDVVCSHRVAVSGTFQCPRFAARHLATPSDTLTWSAPADTHSSSWLQYHLPFADKATLLLLTHPPASTHSRCRPASLSLSLSYDGLTFTPVLQGIKVHPTRTLLIDLADILIEARKAAGVS